MNRQARGVGEDALAELQRRYRLSPGDDEPRAYWLTANWLAPAVRCLSTDHPTRDLKDKMSPGVLAGLDAAGIGIAPATYEITGVPPIKLHSHAGRVRP